MSYKVAVNRFNILFATQQPASVARLLGLAGHQHDVGDGDLRDGRVSHGRAHHLQAGNHLSEGAVVLALGIAFRADAEEGLGARVAVAGASEHAFRHRPRELASPLQVAQKSCRAASSRGQVATPHQTLSCQALPCNVGESRSLIGGPEGAEAEGEEVLRASKVAPQADVHAPEAFGTHTERHDHLRPVQRHQELHRWELGKRTACKESSLGIYETPMPAHTYTHMHTRLSTILLLTCL